LRYVFLFHFHVLYEESAYEEVNAMFFSVENIFCWEIQKESEILVSESDLFPRAWVIVLPFKC